MKYSFTEHEIQFISFAQSRSIDSYNNKNQNKQTKEAKTTNEFYQIDAMRAHSLEIGRFRSNLSINVHMTLFCQVVYCVLLLFIILLDVVRTSVFHSRLA